MSMTRSIAVFSAVLLGLVLSSAVHAGSGCMYQYSAELKAAQNADPIMAENMDPQNMADAEWLALLKKRKLEADNTEGSVVMHN